MRLWRKVGLATAGAGVMLAGTACGSIQALPHLAMPTVNRNAPTTGSVGQKPTGADAASFASSFLQARASAQQAGGSSNGTQAASDQLHATWGPGTTNTDGEYANHSVQPDLKTTSPNDTIYAPTMKPGGGPGGSCVEVVTAYQQTGGAVWAWDWCAATPGPAVVLKIDSSFLANYTTTVNGQYEYTVEETRTDAGTNAWTAQLYNYRTQSWETLYTSSGTDKWPNHDGWDMFEVYSSQPAAGSNASYCSTISGHVFDSTDIQILVNGRWRPVDTTNSAVQSVGDPFACGSLNLRVGSANNHWTAWR